VKQLLLMRHAKSSWGNPDLTDFDRPLKRRGQRAALKMGKHLRKQGLIPSHIVCSTAERAHATAELVLSEFPNGPELELRDELYHALPQVIVNVIRETDDAYDSLLLIGHNPGMEELIFQWSAEFLDFTTASVAYYALKIERWAELQLALSQNFEHLWKPKDLDHESSR